MKLYEAKNICVPTHFNAKDYADYTDYEAPEKKDNNMIYYIIFIFIFIYIIATM